MDAELPRLFCESQKLSQCPDFDRSLRMGTNAVRQMLLSGFHLMYDVMHLMYDAQMTNRSNYHADNSCN